MSGLAGNIQMGNREGQKIFGSKFCYFYIITSQEFHSKPGIVSMWQRVTGLKKY
jgi:hypothetical protein